MQIEFMGIGSANCIEHGFSSALVLQEDGNKLLVDYSITTHAAFWKRESKAPDGIFITHTHHDHISGLQSLYFKVILEKLPKVKLYVPVDAIKQLHKIQGSYESLLAEGGNFWDAFHLVPVSESFWLGNTMYHIFQNQHHALGFSYGICVKNKFLFSGDTKPIPATISSLANMGHIFHDLAVERQPSHTSLDDLIVYEGMDLNRFHFYHLSSKEEIELVRAKGFNVVEIGEIYNI